MDNLFIRRRAMNTGAIDYDELRMISLSSVMFEELYDEVVKRFPNDIFSSNLLKEIYAAVKSNQTIFFVSLLNDVRNKDLVNFIVNISYDEIDGQEVTPLTIAAIQNNDYLVKTILARYDVDVEKECNVMFDGLLVYGATALWVASGMGHMQIVKMLVQYGADVNHNTKAHSSPLRAASYEGRLDIVRYLIAHGADVNLGNAYKNTCIMIAAYKGHYHIVKELLQYGAKPNDQALCGATALHYAAECGNLDVCILLLEHGARLLENDSGLTPVLLAAERVHDDVVRMFISQPGLMTKSEIIKALELLGASYANDKDHYNVTKGYKIMMEAMELRFSNPDDIIRKHVVEPVPAYDMWFETENIAELRAIRLNHHSIHMEALTIRERILGKSNENLVQPIIYRGAIMADQGRFVQCQALWSYALDLRMLNNLTVEAELQRFVQLFSQILRHDVDSLDVNFVLSVLVKCQEEIEKNRIKIKHPGPKDVPRLLSDHNEINICTALHLIKIIVKKLAKNSEQLERCQIELLYATIYKFIKSDTRLPSGQTMLHLACHNITPFEDMYVADICKFPCYRTAMILVHVGAPVNAIDENRMTPLHTLVEHFNKGDNTDAALAEGVKIVKLLVEAGAHLDAVNKCDQTPAQIANIPQLTNLIVNHQNDQSSLKCLAARSIAVNNLPYIGLIPITLEAFIKMHKPEKQDENMY